MDKGDLDKLQKTLSFAMWAIKKFRNTELTNIHGARYLKMFDHGETPAVFYDFLSEADVEIIEKFLPNAANMYETKCLEIEKEIIEKRLIELRSKNVG